MRAGHNLRRHSGMKQLFGIFLIFCVTPAMASLQTQDLLADETILVKRLNLGAKPVADKPILDIDFKPDYSRTLIERGDLSLNRKILMNAGGARIEPTAFHFDLHLEISYKFI